MIASPRSAGKTYEKRRSAGAGSWRNPMPEYARNMIVYDASGVAAASEGLDPRFPAAR